jgi:YCII-related domain.
MVLYMAPIAAEVQMDVSPEEMKKGMEPWLAWYKKCGKSIVDQGAPLGKGICVDKKGAAKGRTQVTGYSIIQANDMDEAKAMVADHPHLLMPKASVEVLEVMPMM